MGLVLGALSDMLFTEIVIQGENFMSTVFVIGRYVVQALWIPKLVV